MDIKSYQDLEVWQKAMDLTMECYKATKKFPKSETYGLCNQLQRAVVSIPANIAEGRGRQYTKEFLQHLSIAYGSLAELETHILLAERLKYIEEEQVKGIMSKTAELGRMINGLRRSLKNMVQGSGVRDQELKDLNPDPRTPTPVVLTPDPRPLIPANKGFSLVELLVAMVIASVVGLAGISIFSSSNWSYKTQEDITEAQQNVRVATDRLAKDIRMAGFGLPDPPFSLTFTNLSATLPTLPNPLTSPVTVTNSTAGPDTITILGIGYEAGTLQQGGVNCGNGILSNNSGANCIRLNSTADFFTGAGPAYEPNRRYISLNGTTFIELATAGQTQASGILILGSPTTLDRNYPDNTPVYIIQAVQYTIVTDLTGCSVSNPCLVSRDYTMLRGGSTPGAREVLAENIEDMQFAYGIDASPRDGKIDYTAPYAAAAFQNNPTDPTSIIAVRATIVGMTRNQDMRGQTGFRAQCFEDRPAVPNTTNCPDPVAGDGYRRRILTKVLKIRNPRTGA